MTKASSSTIRYRVWRNGVAVAEYHDRSEAHTRYVAEKTGADTVGLQEIEQRDGSDVARWLKREYGTAQIGASAKGAAGR